MEIIDTHLEFNSNHSPMGKIEGIVCHNSGVTVLQSVEVIHNYHKNTRKYAGIGYNFYVRKNGNIYKGRPLEWAGAHCPGANTNSIGICFEGNFDVEEMSEVQKQAGKELIAYLKSQYDIKWIKGHKEIIATSCPGANFPLDEMKGVQKAEQHTEPVQPAAYTFENFVREVQSCIGAKIDGIPGSETLSKTPTISARKNRTHPVVRVVQKYLTTLGYTEVGVIDGIAGSKFDNAVRHFQKDNGCVQDGEITAHNKTWKKLLKLA